MTPIQQRPGPLNEHERRRFREAMVERIRAGKPNPFEPSSPAHAAYAFTRELVGHAERAPESALGRKAGAFLSAKPVSQASGQDREDDSRPPLPAKKPEAPRDPFASPHRTFDPVSRTFADALFSKESRGTGGYRAVNPSTNPESVAYGRYQFRAAALIDLGFMDRNHQWTGLYGIRSAQDFLERPEVQDYALAAHMHSIRSNLTNEDNNGIVPADLIGQRVVLRRPNGDQSFIITESALIAMADREGPTGMRRYLFWLKEHGFVSDPANMPEVEAGDTAAERRRNSLAMAEARGQFFADVPYLATSDADLLGGPLP